MGRISLLKAGGISAILYVVVLIVAFALVAATDLIDAEDAVDVLPALDDDQGVVATAGWLFVLAPLLLIVAGAGLYDALRSYGSLMGIAALGFIIGGVFALVRGVVWLAMTYKLAPAFVDAAGTEKASLEVMGDALISIGFLSGDIVGGILIAGVGVPLFSLAGLRTSFTRKWVGWLGFPVALLGGWLVLAIRLSDVIEFITLIGAAGFLLWMLVLGYSMWRSREPAPA